jgi:undecaprenyl-diphosphatase
MLLWQSIVLGLLQGLTEFLPVSSSGHLVFAQLLMKFRNPEELIVFDVLVHVGTLIAVLLYFRKRIFAIFHALLSIGRKEKNIDEKENLKLVWFLILGTIPAVLFGLFFKKYIELSFSSLRWTSIEFLINGLILIATIWAIDRNKQLNNRNTLIMGTAQAIAIIPAISRSGSTIAAGLFSGINKEKAAEFSFLLSIPAIGGAAVLEIPDFLKSASAASELYIYLLGALVAAIIGYLSIAFLLSVIKKEKFFYFGIYCIVLGIAGLIFL